jgi:hypothetical protein
VSPRRYWLAFAVVYALHLAAVYYALPYRVLASDQPFDGVDYQTHYQQLTTLSQAFSRFGRLWAYDPNMLAGYPEGLIFDVDNKAHFLFSYGLTRLGVPRPIAFKLFTLLSCLLAPLFIWLSARLLRVGRRAELLALLGGVLLWNFDYSARFMWTVGMVSFATASYLSIVVLALFRRLLASRSWGMWIALSVLLPLALLTHVWAFAVLAVPMTVMYLRTWRGAGARGHVQVMLLAAFALAGNAHWLVPALRHFGIVARSAIVGQTTPPYFFSDWIEILIDPFATGFAIPHTLFRYAVLCGAVLTLWSWRRERDERFFFATLTLGWLLGITFLAALVPGLAETEPYRFNVPAAFFAATCCGPWYGRALTWSALRVLPREAKALLVICAILILPRVAKQVIYFIPDLVPTVPPILANQGRLPSTFTVPPLGERDPALLFKRLYSIDERMLELARYMQRECREEGRVLVQHWAVGEFLRWATDRPIIGGFPDRRVHHQAANLFRRFEDPRYWGNELADYLVRYHIRYVVVTDPMPPVEGRRDLLEPRRLIGPHRIYRVRHHGTYFLRGTGKVSTGLNRIEVTEVRPAPGTQAVLLSFHHMSTLRCRPGCGVQRSPVPHDPVGFITVVGDPVLPSEFVIENGY